MRSIKGVHRKLLVEANRNGFLYILDRTDGKFLSAVRFAEKMNWAKEIGADGRPIRTGTIPSATGTRVCPGFAGATNWYSPSFNPSTGLFYFLSLENCNLMFLAPDKYAPRHTYYATGSKSSPDDSSQKILLAFDLAGKACMEVSASRNRPFECRHHDDE